MIKLICKFIANEKNGKADGQYESYYENGELEYKAIYKDGKEVEVIIKDEKKLIKTLSKTP